MHPSADEDEGFKAALNIDTSVAQLGFYGQQGEKLWARSGVESLHLWEWAAACDDAAAGARGGVCKMGLAWRRRCGRRLPSSQTRLTSGLPALPCLSPRQAATGRWGRRQTRGSS